MSQTSLKSKAKKAKQKQAVQKKSRAKLTSKSGLKRLKSWKQIPELETDLNDWPAFRQSLVLREPLVDWRQVWKDSKLHPVQWAAGGVLENATKELQNWLGLLKNAVAGKPMKAKHAVEAMQELKNWSESVENRLTQILDGGSSPSETDASDLVVESLVVESLTAAWLLAPASVEAESADFRMVLDSLLAITKTCQNCDDALLQNALGIELPFALTYQYPDLAEVVSASDDLAKLLEKAMDPCLDGNGLPTASSIEVFPLLLASWTRCYQLSKEMSCPLFIDATDDQYQWAVRQYLRMMRSDGTTMLTKQLSSKADLAFLKSMLECNDDLEDWQAAIVAHANSSKIVPSKVKPAKEERLPDAADETEWGKLAIMRSKWKAKSDKLAVDFSGRDVKLELENHRQWLAGPMQTELRVNGNECSLDDSWSEVCWHSDEDCVYLEIENALQNDVGLIQRQFLLSRHYRFCLIADSVMLKAAESGDTANQSIDHHWTLPLADKVSFEAAKETHEGHLIGGKHKLSVLPLTLPEWRVEFSRGSLSAENHQLRSHYSLPAARLYQAVLIDLDHRRSQQPLTWRQLSVGETLEPVSLDKAAGFRVQLDRMQFLIYRSMGPIVGRTVLGHNYYCDFYAGQFLPNGFCEDILLIHGPEGE